MGPPIERLDAVSSVLKSSSANRQDPNDNNNADEHATASIRHPLPLEGLLLWKVLEFALNVQDYGKLSLVNKEWNHAVRTIQPPVMAEIEHLVRNREMETAEDGPINLPRSRALLEEVFAMLKQRDCVLYDTKTCSKSNADESSTCWPHRLQPQFHVVLMRLVLAMGRHRVGDVRDLSLTFVRSLAFDIYGQIVGALDTMREKEEDYFSACQELCYAWQRWEGVVKTVVSVVQRDILLHDHPRRGQAALPTVAEEATTIMARWLVTILLRPPLRTAVERLVADNAKLLLQWMPGSSPQQRALWLQISNAAQAMSGAILARAAIFPTEDGASVTALVERFPRIIPTIWEPVLKQALKEKQEADACSAAAALTVEEGPSVTILVGSEKKTYHVPLDSRLLSDSCFLHRLQLQAGDCICLDNVSSETFDILIHQLYHLPQPIPTVSLHPLGASLVECVGETYSAFLETLTLRQFTVLARDARVLDFALLSNLSSIGMTFRNLMAG